MQFNPTNVFCLLIIFFLSTSLVNCGIFDPYPAYSNAYGSYQQNYGYPLTLYKDVNGFFLSCSGNGAAFGC
ncbi:unnamed protein product [Caenorhabditis auriculariae]|uniref:Uncharacterized protein n=1 Tax=Caenorhabditis auriculariae TaxID=2777116 RepID=A0A8S1HWB0_9PELO|nr:unnamed protein product [Caenorhabditis auriculariae]